MKKTLLIAFALLSTLVSTAQTFVPNSGTRDTVARAWFAGTIEVGNNLRSTSTTPVHLKWKVIARKFDAGWLASSSGVCDNNGCRYDVDDMFTAGHVFYADYDNQESLFDVQFESSNPALGTRAIVTVLMTDSVANYSRTLTFIAYRGALGVGQTVIQGDDIAVYPNPATDAVNVTFDAKAGIKTIAVYNIIGKTIKNYIVTDNNSAKLELGNVPSGVYFIRMMNASGEIVATRRFTKQ